jgi:hypothetical protein
MGTWSVWSHNFTDYPTYCIYEIHTQQTGKYLHFTQLLFQFLSFTDQLTKKSSSFQVLTQTLPVLQLSV